MVRRFEALNDQFIKAVSEWQKNDDDEKARVAIDQDRRTPD